LRQRSLLELGTFARGYCVRFQEKWIEREPVVRSGAEALGSSDIQSLADLKLSYDIVTTMKPLPLEWRLITTIAIATALPALPLALTEVPMQVLLQRLVRVM